MTRTSRRQESPEASPPAPVAPVAAERTVTAQVWARGRMNEPIVRAFVSEQSRKRVEKLTGDQWTALLHEFTTAGRA